MPMAKDRPRAKDADAEKEAKTDVVRVPEDIAEMLGDLAQHQLRGWRSVAAILNDPECPLRDWVLAHYQQMIDEKLKRAKQIKKSSE